MSGGRVIEDLPGRAACAWCGCLVELAGFTEHAEACERAVRAGQRALFGGGAVGLFDGLEGEPCIPER